MLLTFRWWSQLSACAMLYSRREAYTRGLLMSKSGLNCRYQCCFLLQGFQPLWYPEVRMEEVVWLKSYPQLEMYPAKYPSYPIKGISTRWTTTPSVEVEVEV